jgi:hypothetical protein
VPDDPGRLHPPPRTHHFTSADQVARHDERPLDIPVVADGGEACLGSLTLATVHAVAPTATGGVVERSGHWMPEERPDVIIEQACTTQ